MRNWNRESDQHGNARRSECLKLLIVLLRHTRDAIEFPRVHPRTVITYLRPASFTTRVSRKLWPNIYFRNSQLWSAHWDKFVFASLSKVLIKLSNWWISRAKFTIVTFRRNFVPDNPSLISIHGDWVTMSLLRLEENRPITSELRLNTF